jgi:serine protease Do
LQLSNLTEAQRKSLKIKGGVRVVAVRDPAARSGLFEGDILLEVASTEVASVKEVAAVLSRLERGKPVSTLIRREDWVQFVVIKPGR